MPSRFGPCLALLVALAGARADLPTVWLIGDSTVNNGTRGQMGWGTALPPLVDPARATVQNKARGGRSSRTYLTEGLWDQVAAQLRAGDVVLMQFGHNDGGSLASSPRASLKGNGEETQETTDPATGKTETVHTYGWYLRRYMADTKAKGATPLVLSPVPRNLWKDGKVARNSGDYGLWARQAAEAGGALFLDLNSLVADRYDALGQDQVAQQYFGPTDHTHTTAAGAALNAACVAAGLRGLPDCPLAGWLRP